MTLADRLHLCISELEDIHRHPDYRTDWEDLETRLADILILLEILRDTMKDAIGSHE